MRLSNLLELMSDGRFHSGEELGARLGVSRAAVWKSIKALEREYGLISHSVRGKGYRLAQPIELLSAQEIAGLMSERSRGYLPQTDIQLKVDSTNTRVKSLLQNGGSALCLAEMQSAGRGRLGRSWLSPFGKNIYLSFVWRFAHAGVPLDGLSLVVGMGLVKALRDCVSLPEFNRRLAIKWPNDLLFEGRKLAGILIEVIGELDGPMQVIIGVGVNVAMSPSEGEGIDQPWICLEAAGGKVLSRNFLVARILDQLVMDLLMFESGGFAAFAAEWRDLDILAGNRIKVVGSGKEIAGIARGVNAGGALLVETESGMLACHGGDVSVRGWQ